MNYHLFLIGSLVLCSTAQKCSLCSNITIKLSIPFRFFNEDIKIITVSNDRLLINHDNRWIKFHDYSNNTFCSIHTVEINSSNKLQWVSSLLNSSFNAKYALVITWMALGNNKCDASNLFQVIFTTDNINYIVLLNYLENNFDSKKNFYIGVNSISRSNLILTNYSQLVSNSNIGINGKWVFILNKAQGLNSFFYFQLTLLLIYTLIIFFTL